MQQIMLLKLVTGEEIIGKYIKEEDGKVILSKIRVLVSHPAGPEGQLAIAMMPWMVGAPDSEVAVSKSKIIGVPEDGIPKQLEDGYLQQTSGIALASATPDNL